MGVTSEIDAAVQRLSLGHGIVAFSEATAEPENGPCRLMRSRSAPAGAGAPGAAAGASSSLWMLGAVSVWGGEPSRGDAAMSRKLHRSRNDEEEEVVTKKKSNTATVTSISNKSNTSSKKNSKSVVINNIKQFIFNILGIASNNKI